MNIYKRQRFSPDIISYAVWLYHRFNLSHRDIEDLLAERRISVSHGYRQVNRFEDVIRSERRFQVIDYWLQGRLILPQIRQDLG